MTPQEFLLKGTRELVTRLCGYPKNRSMDTERVQYFDNQANELIYNKIASSVEEGLVICKFGNVELATVVANLLQNNKHAEDYLKFLRGYPVPLFYEREIRRLCNNAGFFPPAKEMVDKFVEQMYEWMKDIDILGSSVYTERYIIEHIKHCTFINLKGYFTPFLYENPWTRVLEGKKVLVVHPFQDSILKQYNRREKIWSNPKVLPEFSSLQCIKAVQTIAGERCEYGDWFEALESMKEQMSRADFDVALIGCGAYGLPLAIHAKKLGKVGVHMGGWTQLYFGIYGKRWLVDEPDFVTYINDSWVRPSGDEVIAGTLKVEGGCYW